MLEDVKLTKDDIPNRYSVEGVYFIKLLADNLDVHSLLLKNNQNNLLIGIKLGGGEGGTYTNKEVLDRNIKSYQLLVTNESLEQILNVTENGNKVITELAYSRFFYNRK